MVIASGGRGWHSLLVEDDPRLLGCPGVGVCGKMEERAADRNTVRMVGREQAVRQEKIDEAA